MEVISYYDPEGNPLDKGTLVNGNGIANYYGATAGEVGISKINGAINQAVLCVRSTQSTKYLYQFLLFMKGRILAKYIQGGQGNLSADILKSIRLPLPSKEEQQKIADFLSALDKKIEAVST